MNPEHAIEVPKPKRPRKPRPLKPASAKNHRLLVKLQALADAASRGTGPEREAAQKAVDALKAKWDFSAPVKPEANDIFSGVHYAASSIAMNVYTYSSNELDLAAFVKWSLEAGTSIKCMFNGNAIMAAATPSTANKLASLSIHIAESFKSLLGRLEADHSISSSDRSLFMRGLFDGMMNQERKQGEPLPARRVIKLPKRKPKQGAVTRAPGLGVHPYTLAVDLGKHVRFSAPVETILAELDRKVSGCIGEAVAA